MKRLSASLLAIGLPIASTTAAAQSNYGNDRYGDGYTSQQETYYDYARVLRVDPVLDGRYRTTSNQYSGERCYETTTAGRYERDAYGNGGYRDGRDYRDGYGGYGYGRPSGYGDSASRSMATIAGGIVGAVIGSKVGGGSGRYAATAVGSMVGGMAGRGIYDQTRQDRYVRPSTVRVCDPEPVGRYGDNGYGSYGSSNAGGYDVTYEYNGRQYTRRMDYHPGERVRVRVDVSPE